MSDIESRGTPSEGKPKDRMFGLPIDVLKGLLIEQWLREQNDPQYAKELLDENITVEQFIQMFIEKGLPLPEGLSGTESPDTPDGNDENSTS